MKDDRLISLNAVIEAIHNYWIAEGHKLPRKMVGEYEVLDGDYKSLFRHNKKICEAIKALPSAQQWIPCSKGLPDDLQEVNVTWVNHNPAKYYDFTKDKSFSGSAIYYKGEWYWYSATCVDYLAEYGRNEMDKVDDGIEITAWMPLPKPYKGKDGENG